MKLRFNNNRSHNNKSTVSYSKIFLGACCMVLCWGCFLLYCWKAGLIGGNNGSTTVIDKNEAIGIPIVVTDLDHQQEDQHITSTSSNGSSEGKDEVHVIFSTDCTPYQDWQSLVVFHSAMTVGQIGPVTRIASGCDEAKKEELTALYKKLYPKYYVHFTPDFKRDEATNQKYDFYNKPRGLNHWLDNAVPSIPDDVVIALIDPDMIFLRPITLQVKGYVGNIFSKSLPKKEIFDTIGEGHPVAQTYGLGAPWTNDNHRLFNRGQICGEGSPCLTVTEKFGNQHYSVGPPYIVHKKDMLKIARRWTDLVPKVYVKYPYLLAEMYAYSMAAAHEELPHLQAEHHMVSNTGAPDEGWAHIDALENVCEPPDINGIYYPSRPLPTLLHFCQSYRAGEYGWTKRQNPKDIFSCDSPIYVDTPYTLQDSTYMIKKKVKVDMKNKVDMKRNAFMICTIHRSINAAVVYYKKRMCQDAEKTNFEKSLNVVYNMS